jgi:hypothetical protein
MYLLRRGFTDEIVSLFDWVKVHLFAEYERVELGKEYDVAEMD